MTQRTMSSTHNIFTLILLNTTPVWGYCPIERMLHAQGTHYMILTSALVLPRIPSSHIIVVIACVSCVDCKVIVPFGVLSW